MTQNKAAEFEKGAKCWPIREGCSPPCPFSEFTLIRPHVQTCVLWWVCKAFGTDVSPKHRLGVRSCLRTAFQPPNNIAIPLSPLKPQSNARLAPCRSNNESSWSPEMRFVLYKSLVDRASILIDLMLGVTVCTRYRCFAET